ncbi:DUF6340 family protein [Mangrovimonas spongiae]|uniref:Tetratricopeptide repeat protein n=1 Tax=Mangrovimonas spongiae TaxID=2494697 RepID=A0A3R9UTN5_9FLAO|nr:DUF6340 family protein [Mangrovimonas spongiae]RSK39873.1 hypothetical protein EJA19_08300 [Mangrovimonas spongiae]
MKFISKTVFCLGLAVMTFSCATTNRLTLSVTEPAPVYIDKDISQIGILNRSLATDENQILDKIDKILSIEDKNLDEDGANYTIEAIKNQLSRNNRFKSINIIESNKVENPGLGIFPSAIPWNVIEEICLENNIDAIISLSFYDTDATINYTTNTVQKVNAFGIKVPVIEHQATINTLIKIGFRVYDNQSKQILDEIIVNQTSTSTGKGVNPTKAIEALKGRREAVLQSSTLLGQDYALRTLPYKIRVSRDYYVKGTNNFEIGKRRAQTGDWDGAAQLWEKELNNPKPKIAGRACYNMAIINEINGNLERALQWASKAYTDYNDKIALRYVNILKQRMRKNVILNQQHQD